MSEYRDRLNRAFIEVMPALRPVTIPGDIVKGIHTRQQGQGFTTPAGNVVDSQPAFAQTRLYGTDAGRAFQVELLPQGPSADNARLLVGLHAHLRWAPPGHEPERRLPWLLYGALPGKLAMNGVPFSVRQPLATATRERPQSTRPVGRTPLGRELLAASSFPGSEAWLRGREWAESYAAWELLVGPNKMLGGRLAPIVVGNFPSVTLVLETDPSLPSERYADLLRSFAGQLDNLERSFGAPPASELPIETHAVELVPGFAAPEPSPLYVCPKCGAHEDALRLKNGWGVLLGVQSRSCRADLFQRLP